jgi:hypothetical protein
MDLLTSIQLEGGQTENGMTTNLSSLDRCVDLFFKIGASRKRNSDEVFADFSLAWAEDPLKALKILFWARDIRGGAGERKIFRDILSKLAVEHHDVLEKNLHLVPHFGRWDDLLCLEGTELWSKVCQMIEHALSQGDGLCAKWMPRGGREARVLRTALGVSPKQWRKTLVRLTQVVETKMCDRRWNEIEYSKVPSLASARYSKAFVKHDPVGYRKWKEDLKSGESKVNASAVYPYDVVKILQNRGDIQVAEQMWESLPDFMDGSTSRILPLVDTSGSMKTTISQKSTTTCLDISLSLGIYISQRNIGPFKDAFITFSTKPTLQILKGSLFERYNQLRRADWNMSTNLEAAFGLILDSAVRHQISQDEMPQTLLILSDMEFDAAIKPYRKQNPTAFSMIEQQYSAAGYKMPQIVFWNLQSRRDNVPVRSDQTGAALVSGFSPSIMKSLLGGEVFTPVSIMNQTIDSERYSIVTT